MAGKIKVPSELVPSQSNKIMLRSKYVYDDVKGHTQEEVNAALEEQIESKVIEAGGVNWDVVPTAGSNNAVKSKDIKAALEKVTGYFVLDSNVTESTVGKTVTVADFPALAIGGSIKIKMLTKNTATNPTLKIGPANATVYPLYYNEERASANNSWEENEIISVFFDGANYRASNSQGGSNKKIDAYLLGDLRTLSVGQTYEENEAVKTEDKQLLRVIKPINTLKLTDEINIGDLKAIISGTNIGTYQAQKAISAYSDTTYSDGDYAIGSPAGAVIQVTIDSETVEALEEAVDIIVTIADIDITVSVDSESQATSIATDIYTEFGTQEEWKLTDNNDGTLTLISKVAKDAIPTISSQVGESGVTIGFVENSAYAGSKSVSTYLNNSWETVALEDYLIAEIDGEAIWSAVADYSELITLATIQDTDILRLKKEPIVKKNISFGSTISGYIDSNGKWSGSNYHYLVPIDATIKGTYILETRETENTYYAWLKDTSTTGTPSYADNVTKSTLVAKNSRVKLTPPNKDARYLYLLYRISSTYYSPKSLTLEYQNTYEILDGLREDVNAINVNNVNFEENNEADLVISDENYNDIVQFKDGHIRTKHFDSSKMDIDSFGIFKFIRNKYAGLRCAIVGDSISTFSGTIPSGYSNYYPNGDVTSQNHMWWKIACNAFGMTPVNCSWSGSKVTGAPKGATASAGCSDQRIADMGRNGTPDIIIFYIGCNDWGNDISLGTWNVDDLIIDDTEYSTSDTVTDFRAAYALMLYKTKVAYPHARLFCCTILDEVRRDDIGKNKYPPINSNHVSNYTWNQSIKEIAEALGAAVIDMHDCGVNYFNLEDYYSVDAAQGALHPNKAGHALMANKVISDLISK